MSSLKYEYATFRILVGNGVMVEISVRGSNHNSHDVYSSDVLDTGRTIQRIAKAVQRIQRQIDAERGERASLAVSA